MKIILLVGRLLCEMSLNSEIYNRILPGPRSAVWSVCNISQPEKGNTKALNTKFKAEVNFFLTVFSAVAHKCDIWNIDVGYILISGTLSQRWSFLSEIFLGWCEMRLIIETDWKGLREKNEFYVVLWSLSASDRSLVVFINQMNLLLFVVSCLWADVSLLVSLSYVLNKFTFLCDVSAKCLTSDLWQLWINSHQRGRKHQASVF